MMRPRVLLMVSLACNVLLLALWLARPRGAGQPAAAEVAEGLAPATEVRTNVQVFRQYFSWADLESEDYTTYIENLRRIGCPEQTIRDIIVADVDHLYRENLGAGLIPTMRQWWQSQPDSRILDQATAQRKALARERYTLLTRLLGEGWDTDQLEQTPTVALEVPLDGPLLSIIPPDRQREIQQLSGRTQRRYEAILREAERRGEEFDTVALVQVYQELKAGLASLLSPAQLEEFGIRYSPIASRLRSELAGQEFALSPTEFRTLYRAAEPIEVQLLALGPETPATAIRRRGLLEQRDAAFRNALGPARYREYQAAQDPAFRSAVAAAEAAGTPEAAPFLEAIGEAGADVATLIDAETGGAGLRRQIELKRLELEQLEAAAAVLGQSVPSNEPPAPRRNTYALGREESLAEVSRKTGVPVALLLQANPGLQLNDNPAGTTIVIPPWNAPPGLR